jgi:multiple sugar transport system ATP-binding protein
MPFGTVTIPEERARNAQGKGLLIAGIRPEHFEDASVMDDGKKAAGSTFRTKVDVVEWLGNEAYAYIPFEAPPEVQEQLNQLEKDLDGDQMRTQLVVSLDGASRISEGDEAEIWVDATQIHLFDPSTGENLTVDLSRAGRIPEREDPSAKANAEKMADRGEQVHSADGATGAAGGTTGGSTAAGEHRA